MTNTSTPDVKVLTPECPLCRGAKGKPYVTLNFDQATRLAAARKSGQYIQEALPDVSAGDREQIITGAHGACFDEAFAFDDEED